MRAADGVWKDLKRTQQANLCEAYQKYPKKAIKGAFKNMAASDQAVFSVEGATALQVWDAPEQRHLRNC